MSCSLNHLSIHMKGGQRANMNCFSVCAASILSYISKPFTTPVVKEHHPTNTALFQTQTLCICKVVYNTQDFTVHPTPKHIFPSDGRFFI